MISCDVVFDGRVTSVVYDDTHLWLLESEVELPGGSTCSWESYPHDSQGESKAKLKQRFTDLTKDNVS